MSETILYVDRWYSRCAACGKNADPAELSHDMLHMEGGGCGAVYTHIAPSCIWPGVDDTLRAMRPDLELIETGLVWG